jgi:3-methyladenine DNA glycosylase AlkD
MTEIQEKLFALRDPQYGEFQRKLMPTVSPDAVIGVRTPELRKLAKALDGRPEAEEFLAALPHRYYEENNLHAFLIESSGDFRRTIGLLEAFLPYVDNWATCDSMSPKAFRKHPPELLPEIRRWIGSSETYTIRFGIEMLMNFYLDGEFRPEYLALVAALRSEEYYVNMMIAWFFATALAKQYDAALPYLKERRLASWTHNKTIQKAVESYRIPDERKAYLKSLRVR